MAFVTYGKHIIASVIMAKNCIVNILLNSTYHLEKEQQQNSVKKVIPEQIRI